MKNIHQVTIVFPDATENHTKLFSDETDASIHFDEYFDEKDGKDYVGIFHTVIEPATDSARLICYWRALES